MSMPSPSATMHRYHEKQKASINILVTQGKKAKGNRISVFFRNLNPANWFNEFSDIEITMEELGSTKKQNQDLPIR